MRSNRVIWIGLFIIAALATLAAKYFPYFPGDVAVERWVQALLSPNLNWAEGLKRTGDFPWVLLILALVLALSWALASWRAAAGVGLWGRYVCRPRIAIDLARAQ